MNIGSKLKVEGGGIWSLVPQFDSPTARYSDSLIGNMNMMCMGFLKFFYFFQMNGGHIEIQTVQLKHKFIIFIYSIFFCYGVGLSSCRTVEPLDYRFASRWGGGKTDMKVSAPIFNAVSIFPKNLFKNGLGLAIPSPATFPYIELYKKKLFILRLVLIIKIQEFMTRKYVNISILKFKGLFLAWEFKCILILSTWSLICNPLFTSRYALLCSMLGLWDLYSRPCLHVTCVNMYVHVQIMFVDLLWSKYLLFLDEELLVRLKSKKSIKFLVLCHLHCTLYLLNLQFTCERVAQCQVKLKLYL